MDGALPKSFTRFCVAFTVLLLTIQFSPFVPWLLNRLVGNMWINPDGDTLIVLTANEPQNGPMGPVTFARGLYGYRAWRDGHFHAVVVCGLGAGAVGQLLAAYGVPQDRIFLEERVSSVRDCALSTKQMTASWPGRRVLVTSDIGIFRAQRTFTAAGLVVEPRPFPDLLKYWSSQVWRIPETMNLLAEIGKIGYYRARGWIRL